MKTDTRRHSADLLFTFLLLLLFALFSFLLAGIGATVYRRSAAKLDENYTSRTAVAYVAEKIRQCGGAEAVSFEEIDGVPAIVLHSEYAAESGGLEAFLTYIYYWDGALCELFARETTPAAADMGSSLLELSDFSFSYEEPLLFITAVSPDGESLSATLCLQR